MISNKAFALRRKRILKEQTDSCVFFFSNPVATASRDVTFPYRPNSDLFYLTGLREPKVCLVLRTSGSKRQSYLYLRERSPEREIWEGPRTGLAWAKRNIDVTEVHPIEQLAVDIPELCENVSTVYLPFGVHREWEEQVLHVVRGHEKPRYPLPHTVSDARLLTAPLRYVKEKDEIAVLQRACDISAEGFIRLGGALGTLSTERDVARYLETQFVALGGDGLAFDTTAAFGPNTTNLHHTPTSRTAQKKELLLVDAGASLSYYCADITRTFPSHGEFTAAQRTIYEIVDHARKVTIAAIRPGITMDQLHRVSVKEITRGLAHAKVVKEPAAALLMSGNFQRYYMHRVGHFVGLDVHDVAPYHNPRTSENTAAARLPFLPGVVLTVEPGLYFQKGDTSVAPEYRGIGIRIEDTVVVTRGGAKVLTSHVPTAAEEIQKMVRA